MNSRKRIVIICRRPPYGNALSRESLEIALAASVFDQDLAVVFTGDGVWQLHKEQDSDDINTKNQSKLVSALSIYDINEIYIDSDALHERQLHQDDLIIEGRPLTRESLGNLIDSFDVIFNF